MSDRKPAQSAADFHPQVLRLFDQYVHGLIDRRGFLAGAGRYAAGAAGAVGLLAALSPQFAAAQVVAADDSRLDAAHQTFDSPAGYGKARGYLVRPKAAQDALPLVLVIHENRGLNPHIEDVARRLALAGYLVFAPDALFPLGGYPGDEDQARTLFGTLDQVKVRADFLAAVGFLEAQPGGNGKLGVTGFCYGGGISNWLATQLPQLKAAAPFYGAGAPLDQVHKIKAELLIALAEHDERVNAGWPDYEAALKDAGVTYTAHIYPGAQHGFNNNTTPRYDEKSAHLAWSRMLELFERTLRG